MKRTLLIPMAATLFAAACSENLSNPVEDNHGPSLASVHLKGGARAEPTFSDGGLTLSVSGALSGLSGADIFVGLDATANASATCTNPGTGEHQPAGQNPAPTEVSGGEAIPAGEIKNGNVTFSVTTEAPESPVEGAPGCPNPNWTQDITDLSFLTATITVHQPAGTVQAPGPTVLTISCSLTAAGGAGTSDGTISAGQVSCTQT